jgi:hypothetical protein
LLGIVGISMPSASNICSDFVPNHGWVCANVKWGIYKFMTNSRNRIVAIFHLPLNNNIPPSP